MADKKCAVCGKKFDENNIKTDDLYFVFDVNPSIPVVKDKSRYCSNKCYNLERVEIEIGFNDVDILESDMLKDILKDEKNNKIQNKEIKKLEELRKKLLNGEFDGKLEK